MADDANTKKRINWLSVFLWAAQILVALFFLRAAGSRLLLSTSDIATSGMKLLIALPEGVVRFVSVMEFLGAVGLILPAATRILPFLTPVAAGALAIEQVSVLTLHTMRGEATWPINLPLIVLCLFIAWGRWRAAPIASR